MIIIRFKVKGVKCSMELYGKEIEKLAAHLETIGNLGDPEPAWTITKTPECEMSKNLPGRSNGTAKDIINDIWTGSSPSTGKWNKS